MTNYSLWIPIEGECGQEIKKIIDRLADQYNAPKFDPHLTITGGIEDNFEEVEKKTQQLAKSAKSRKLSLTKVSFSTTFFQSVLVRVEASSWLMSLFMQSREIFSLPVVMYMPHVSLMYGLNSMEQRETTAKAISFKNKRFQAKRILIISYDPDSTSLESWQVVGNYPFGK